MPEEAYSHYALINYDDSVLQGFKEVLARRWGSTLQLDGILFASAKEESLKVDLNSPYVCLIPVLQDPDKQWSVSFAAINAAYAGQPARPYQNIKVPGIKSSKRGVTPVFSQNRTYGSVYGSSC